MVCTIIVCMNESLKNHTESSVDESTDDNVELTPEEFYQVQTSMEREVTAAEIIDLAEKSGTPIEEVEILSVEDEAAKRNSPRSKVQIREQAQLKEIRKNAKQEAQEKKERELQESRPVSFMSRMKAWFKQEKVDERTLSEIVVKNNSSDVISETEVTEKDTNSFEQDDDEDQPTVLEEFSATQGIEINSTLSYSDAAKIIALKEAYNKRKEANNKRGLPEKVRSLFSIESKDNRDVNEAMIESERQERR